MRMLLSRGQRTLVQAGEEGLCSMLPFSSRPSSRVLPQLQAVREAHAQLLQRAEGRGQALREQLRLHQLEQEARLLDAWLSTKVAAAESQDYGQDLEDIEVG